uniref:Placenta associated 8 n=1 Tax=Phasianus colchicus TaxID=9054 RepID=A0A669PU06_PHACC
MAVPTVVTLQPQAVAMATNAKPMWQTGLMDCFTDWSVCCCGLFCFPCLACTVAGDMNECCLCGTSVAMRTLYRTRYNIPVTTCDHSMFALPLCLVWMGFHQGSPDCTFPKQFGMHVGCWWRCHPVSRQQASSSLQEQWGRCAGGAPGHWPGGA